MAKPAAIAGFVRDSRPQPPFGADDLALRFEPDQDGLGAWARRTFIDEGGVLENPRHAHLRHADIGWLWTNAEHRDRNRIAAGTCQLIQPAQAKWSSQRQLHQLLGWFGAVPDALIILSASIAREMTDREFCALVSHELCHIGQDEDEHGMPRFTRDGEPIFRMLAHDISEFVDVVEQFGATSAALRIAAESIMAGPLIGDEPIRFACGACSK